MFPSHHPFFLVCLLSVLLLCSCQPQPSHRCDETFSFINSTLTVNITHCKKLRLLGAELGWNLHYTAANITNRGNTGTVVDIVFAARAPSPTGWVAWGVNPGPRPEMVGTRALIAIGQSSGSPIVATYNVTRDVKNGCKLENSSIEVTVENMGSQYSGDSGQMTVWATLSLPADYSVSRLNHVWQVGAMAAGLVPRMHAMRLENFDAAETIDLTSGWSRKHRKEKLRPVNGEPKWQNL